jgi:hypothetical protein
VPTTTARDNHQEVTMSQTTTTAPGACRDCGGPLVQAFDTSGSYDRCRRCGHVFLAEDTTTTTRVEDLVVGDVVVTTRRFHGVDVSRHVTITDLEGEYPLAADAGRWLMFRGDMTSNVGAPQAAWGFMLEAGTTAEVAR